MEIFAFIGIAMAAWWLTGVAMFAFSPAVYVSKGAPLSVKLSAVLHAGFALPKMALMNGGRIPAIIITPEEPDPDEEARVKAWMEENCPCSVCQRRRAGR